MIVNRNVNGSGSSYWQSDLRRFPGLEARTLELAECESSCRYQVLGPARVGDGTYDGSLDNLQKWPRSLGLGRRSWVVVAACAGQRRTRIPVATTLSRGRPPRNLGNSWGSDPPGRISRTHRSERSRRRDRPRPVLSDHRCRHPGLWRWLEIPHDHRRCRRPFSDILCTGNRRDGLVHAGPDAPPFPASWAPTMVGRAWISNYRAPGCGGDRVRHPSLDRLHNFIR